MSWCNTIYTLSWQSAMAEDAKTTPANSGADWRGTVAQRVTHRMLWVVLAAVVLLLGAAVLDALAFGGCIDILGYRSSGCKSAATAEFPEGAVVAFWNDANINDLENQCPGGWVPFEEGRGRFLIGAGDPSDPDFEKWQPEGDSNPKDVSTHQPKKSGGEEEHTLTIEQMPRHNHSIDDPGHGHQSHWLENTRAGSDQGWTGTDGTFGEEKFKIENSKTAIVVETEGEGETSNNMPPYIALYFCKYEGTG